MIRKKVKIAIVGAGAVGTSTAFDLSIQGLCDEIVLVDINQKRRLPRRWIFSTA